MPESSNAGPTVRAMVLGLFFIFFGIALGAMTFLSLVGPLFGLLLVAFGIYIIWSSARNRKPPEPLS